MDSTIRPVALFTGAYLLVATPLALRQQNTEFVFYIAVVLALATGILLLHRRVGLSAGVLWALSLWGLLHMLGGLVRVPESWPTDNNSGVLYSLWLIPGHLKYDNPVHAFGFAVATQVCWECLRTVPGVRPTLGILALCALGGMGLGSLNEVVEFAATPLIPNTNVGGYVNTGWDLVANMLGALTTATIIWLRGDKSLRVKFQKADFRSQK